MLEKQVKPISFPREIALLLLLLLSFQGVQAQLIVTAQSSMNFYCNGCTYSGSSILINEVMISPFNGDGSIYGLDITRRGEWIELYNPDSCCPRDISCFFLGNNATDGDPALNYPGGFELPPGTIVPPSGFVIVRGSNALPVPANLLLQNGGKTIEIVVDENSQVCMGGGERLWFPNNGGWFCFYDDQGVPQDAIYWNFIDNFEPFTHPCDPDGGCPLNTSLPSFNQIPVQKKTYICQAGPSTGFSFCRIPDGGPWAVDQVFAPTYGECNLQPCPQANPCNGSASVTVSGGTPPYTFLWSDCLHQGDAQAVGLCGGVYCCTVSDAIGNQEVACIEVVDYQPVVSIPVFDSMCLSADSLPLSGGLPAGGYYSGPGVVDDVFFPLLAGTGNHYIHYHYHDNMGCLGSDSSLLMVLPAPTVQIVGNDDTVCTGEALVVSGFASGGTGPPYTYSWSGPSGFLSSLQNIYIDSAGINHSGMYYLEVRDQFDCKSMIPTGIQLTVLPRPLARISFHDTAFCEGQNITLWASVISGSPPMFPIWSGPGGFSSTLLSPTIINATPAKSGQYLLSVIDGKQCSSFAPDTLNLTVYPQPDMIITPSYTAVCKDTTLRFTLSGAETYHWNSPFAVVNLGNGLFSVFITASTNFQVTGTSADGCEAEVVSRVEVMEMPAFSLPDTVYLCEGEQVQFRVDTWDSLDYLWSSGETTPWMMATKTGDYVVRVSYRDCFLSDTVHVLPCTELWVPNAFTPNGDGKNDFFIALSSRELKEFQMWIYTRWGALIYQSDDILLAWDGTIDGEICKDDVFVYCIRYRPAEGGIRKKVGMAVIVR